MISRILVAPLLASSIVITSCGGTDNHLLPEEQDPVGFEAQKK